MISRSRDSGMAVGKFAHKGGVKGFRGNPRCPDERLSIAKNKRSKRKLPCFAIDIGTF